MRCSDPACPVICDGPCDVGDEYDRAATAAISACFDEPEHRGAFRALAEIGLAIAGGELLRFVEDRSNGRHSEAFLRRKGGSCDACTEAGIVFSIMRRQLLGAER